MQDGSDGYDTLNLSCKILISNQPTHLSDLEVAVEELALDGVTVRPAVDAVSAEADHAIAVGPEALGDERIVQSVQQLLQFGDDGAVTWLLRHDEHHVARLRHVRVLQLLVLVL